MIIDINVINAEIKIKHDDEIIMVIHANNITGMIDKSKIKGIRSTSADNMQIKMEIEV